MAHSQSSSGATGPTRQSITKRVNTSHIVQPKITSYNNPRIISSGRVKRPTKSPASQASTTFEHTIKTRAATPDTAAIL